MSGSRRDILDYAGWSQRFEALRAGYGRARPYPHAVLDDLLDPIVAKQIERDFPPLGDAGWTHYKHVNEFKQGKSRRDEIPASILQVMDELNSERFRALLSRLTGIEGLLPDLEFSAGGGLSQCARGGFLNLHTDFTVHPYHASWRRRVNLIFYLNDGWNDAWGGQTELWDEGLRPESVVRVAPRVNRALVFSTDPPSFHGHPDPLACPDGVVRRSLALYYFTEEAHPRSVSTHYEPRPGDAPLTKLLIRLDRGLIAVYHWLKTRLGLSDRFASRVLELLARLRGRG